MMKKKFGLVCLLLILLFPGCSFSASQRVTSSNGTDKEKYPNRPVTVLIHVAAGGGTDVMTRVIFSFVEKKLGVPFVCENYPGSGGQIAYTKLSQAKPDGYTIGVTNTTSIVTMDIMRKVPFKLKENFQPLCRVVADPSTVFVKADSHFKTIDDLIDYAKKNPQKLSWGGTMKWGAHHIHYEMFKRETDAKLTYIPFDGVAETRAAILGGHIDVAAGGATEYVEQVKSGQLRALVVADERRFEDLADVPTYKELGYNIIIASDRGYSAPAGIPRERAEILANAIKEVLEDPEFLAQAEKIGIKPIIAYMDIDTWTNYLYQLQDEILTFFSESESNVN